MDLFPTKTNSPGESLSSLDFFGLYHPLLRVIMCGYYNLWLFIDSKPCSGLPSFTMIQADVFFECLREN